VQRSADAQRGWAATPLDDRLDALRRAADAVDALLAGRMDRDPDGLDTSVLDTAELLSRSSARYCPTVAGRSGSPPPTCATSLTVRRASSTPRCGG
jgi:hypothetical protein